MKNYIYDFLLPFYVANDDLRPIMGRVHKDTDGYIYATDAHILIRIPADQVSNNYETIEYYPNVKAVFAPFLNQESCDMTTHSVVVNDLIQVLSQAKWHKEKVGRTCPECEGGGRLECEACGHTHECDDCRGEGHIDEVKEFALLTTEDNGYFIRILNKTFKASLLHIVAMSAKMAGYETIEYVADSNAAAGGLFKFADVVILVMPASGTDGDVIFNLRK